MFPRFYTFWWKREVMRVAKIMDLGMGKYVSNFMRPQDGWLVVFIPIYPNLRLPVRSPACKITQLLLSTISNSMHLKSCFLRTVALNGEVLRTGKMSTFWVFFASESIFQKLLEAAQNSMKFNIYNFHCLVRSQVG